MSLEKSDFRVTEVRPGYSHQTVTGKCPVGATVDDVKRLFYDPYFGGREAWVDGKGNFGVVVHTD